MGGFAIPHRPSQRQCQGGEQPPQRHRHHSGIRTQYIIEDTRRAALTLRQQHLRRTRGTEGTSGTEETDAVCTYKDVCAEVKQGDAHRTWQQNRPHTSAENHRTVLERATQPGGSQQMVRHRLPHLRSQRHQHLQSARSGGPRVAARTQRRLRRLHRRHHTQHKQRPVLLKHPLPDKL